ncbi:nucleotidyltransferase domain-containing protein [Patescibacteria group bacterium]|nr:nucleotidyltransferase domain-containing protein [Patescibacteria group bacterium]
MTKIKLQKSIREITKKIVREVKPEKVILFGSHAWGRPKPDSDLDIFVIKKSNEPRRKRQLKLRRLLLDFDMPADILSYTPEEVKRRLELRDFFIINIIKKGKVLYER